MIPNIDFAKKLFSEGGFSEYSSAYILATEDIRKSMPFIPKNTENALTVAASGDHPLFTQINGAKNIDTFDISYNAKIIMDIKTAAMSLFNRTEYFDLLRDLCVSKDAVSVKNMPQVIEKLSPTEQKYIREMRGFRLFGHAFPVKSATLLFDALTKYAPDESEFNKMQKAVKSPFTFIWSDVASLHTKLDKKYDFIHLSNIYDYVETDKYAKILVSLMKHTNPGTVIYYESTHHDNFYYQNILKTDEYKKSIIAQEQQWQETFFNAGKYALQRIR